MYSFSTATARSKVAGTKVPATTRVGDPPAGMRYTTAVLEGGLENCTNVIKAPLQLYHLNRPGYPKQLLDFKG